MFRLLLLGAGMGVALSACSADAPPIAAPPLVAVLSSAPEASPAPFEITELASFNEPWAMSFLPDGRLLVTEKQGELKLHTLGGASVGIKGVPMVAYGGQGGFGDVVLHPEYSSNNLVYLSYAAGEGSVIGAVVARARLQLAADGGELKDLQVIWRQTPKVAGRGHYGHRIAFGPDGMLYISSGERQQFDPAQDMTSNMGKILRLNADGSVPADNPFAGQGEIASQVWTLGHRNPLGIAFDAQARLWCIEMGPLGGDEFNLIERGSNYGYPIVSNGDHYDGRNIPDHETRPEFNAPEITWTPVISPSNLIFYSGTLFPEWQGNAIAAGLVSKALIRIAIDGNNAHEVARYAMGERIREVEQGPDGAIYVLQDGRGAKLLKLTPKA